jgi:alkylation response protein AidB-like acyl-CoA dehydrogenase
MTACDREDGPGRNQQTTPFLRRYAFHTALLSALIACAGFGLAFYRFEDAIHFANNREKAGGEGISNHEGIREYS